MSSPAARDRRPPARLVRDEHRDAERLRHLLQPRGLRPEDLLPLHELVAGELHPRERGDAVDDHELRAAVDDGPLQVADDLRPRDAPGNMRGEGCGRGCFSSLDQRRQRV